MGWLTNKIRKIVKEEAGESTNESRFKYTSDKLENVNAKLDSLYALASKEYVYIDPIYRTFYQDNTFDPKEAREHFRSLGYIYVNTFETLGELWIKEGKK